MRQVGMQLKWPHPYHTQGCMCNVCLIPVTLILQIALGSMPATAPRKVYGDEEYEAVPGDSRLRRLKKAEARRLSSGATAVVDL